MEYKGRAKEEIIQVIEWLSGFDEKDLGYVSLKVLMDKPPNAPSLKPMP